MERSQSVSVKKKSAQAQYLTRIFERLKTIKHIEYIVGAVFIGVLVLILLSGSIFSSGAVSGSGERVSFTLEEYANAMEQKMSSVLGSIEGAGKVRVMITYESGVELLYAETVSSQSNVVRDEYNGGYRETNVGSSQNSPVIVGGKPVILKEIQPKVKGVLVVAEGAGSIKVKIELLKAVSTLLDVDQKYIEIFTMRR